MRNDIYAGRDGGPAVRNDAAREAAGPPGAPLLSKAESLRYARHLSLPEIGESGQRKLRASRVLVVGAGGLGSPAALYLAAAGVGTLGLLDGDRVELSNLQRQILHRTADLDRPKTESAAEHIRALNPEVTVQARPVRLTEDQAERVCEYDFVLDATDNFESKFLIADACHRFQRPYCHAGILAFSGQVMTVLPGASACYRCIFEAPPPPAEGSPIGPVGALPGVIGSLQALEAIKYITGAGELLTDRLLIFDALKMKFREIALRRNPECALCANQKAKDRV